MNSAVQTDVAGPAVVLARPLLLWHLLSLDGPSVATLWTWAIAHAAALSLTPAWLAAVFLAVWILYAADRLLDATRSAAPRFTNKLVANELVADELEERHRFHARHRRAFRVGLAAASVALIPLVPMVPAAAMRLYLVLAAVLGLWLLMIHLLPAIRKTPARPLPKELAVGLFFAAAAAIPAMAERPELRLKLLPVTLLFASLCSLNCVLIYTWEHPFPAGAATARPSLRFARRHVRFCVAGLLLLAAVIAGACGPWSPVAFAVALSAALLLLLDRWPPADATLLRAAADLALLTPVLFLIAQTIP